MRVVLVGVAVLLVALSGCMSDDPKTQEVRDDASGTTCTATVNATAASASCTGGNSTGSKTGSASASGTKAPTSNAAGNATGNATGDASGNVTGNATGNATGNETAAAPAVPQAYSGSTTVSVASCPESTLGIIGTHPYDPYPGGPLEGVEWLAFAVDPGTIGQTYEWSNGQVVPLIWGVGLAFYDAADDLVLFEIDGTGTVPDGAALGVFYPCGPGPINVTYVSPAP